MLNADLVEPVVRGMAHHAKKMGASTVMRVRFMVGMMTGFEEESFKNTFSILAKNTLLEGAELEVSFYPGNGIEILSFDID